MNQQGAQMPGMLTTPMSQILMDYMRQAVVKKEKELLKSQHPKKIFR